MKRDQTPLKFVEPVIHRKKVPSTGKQTSLHIWYEPPRIRQRPVRVECLLPITYENQRGYRDRTQFCVGIRRRKDAASRIGSAVIPTAKRGLSGERGIELEIGREHP
jgi:hypothetical protein